MSSEKSSVGRDTRPLSSLKEIHGRLGLVQVTYPAPRRVSLEHSIELIETFTEERSGGDRFEAVTAALFQTLGPFWGMFSTVRRAKVTTADTSAGMLGDIECVDDAKNVVLLVEAKDRALTITQVQEKIPGLRANKVSEAFFVAGEGILAEDEDAVRNLIAQEFVSGQNIYITDLIRV